MDPVFIYIPCYNAERFIEATLQSVLTQSYRNLEILVCDDQSTDRTVEKVKQCTDPRLKLIRNPTNLGLVGNYNNILNYASGKYTKMLCADDILEPDCIEKQVQAFETHVADKVVLVSSNRKNIIDESGKRLFTMKIFPGEGLYDGKKAIKMNIYRGGNILGEPGAPLMRTDALKSIHTIQQDADLWIKILTQGNLFVLNEPIFNFRIAPGSDTTSRWFRKRAKIYFKTTYKGYRSNPVYGLTHGDIAIGLTVAWVKMYARSLVTWWIMRKSR
jgi:glycosyltransferase involved in cell wall biosynthesis